MLSSVRVGEELNEQAIKFFLKKHGLINDLNNELKISQFSNGYSNLTYLLQIDHKELVLRKPPKGAIKRGHDMSREYKVLSNLSQHFNKVPKTFAYAEKGEVMESSFYLMEKIDGVIINMKEAVEKDISADEFKIIADQWTDALVELHALDYEQVGLSELGRPEGYVSRQVANWSKQYLKAATRENPAAEFVMKWMEDNQPSKYEHCLIHNDFKYDNLVFAENDWTQIKAILDWEMCTLGDPLMDLGTSLGYWTMANDGPAKQMGIPSPTFLPGNPSRSDLVQAYAIRSGRDINHLVFYYVYGLFKIAVIAQQIFYRYNKGLTSNEKFARLDEVCLFLCSMANVAIDKKRIDNLF